MMCLTRKKLYVTEHISKRLNAVGNVYLRTADPGWKEVSVAYAGVGLDGRRKTMKISVRIFGVPAEIRTGHLQSTRYR